MDLLTALNLLFAKFGLDPIPEGVTPDQLPTLIAGVAMAIPGDESTEPDATTDASGANAVIDAAGGGATGAGAPAMMANLLRQVDQRIVQANKPVLDALNKLTAGQQAANQAAAETAEQSFMKFYNALGKAGVVEAILAPKKEVASKCGWPTALLEGLHPTIKLSNLVSAAAATTEPPNDEGKTGLSTDDAVAARIKARGGNPANMPKAGV